MYTLQRRTEFNIFRKPQGSWERTDKGERSRQGPDPEGPGSPERTQVFSQEQHRLLQRAVGESGFTLSDDRPDMCIVRREGKQRGQVGSYLNSPRNL